MRAIQATKPGGPGVLKYVERPTPEPGPGQILVRTSAIGVNFIDTYRRSGVYKMPFPHIPGSEGTGEVVALGPSLKASDDVHVGAQVAWADSVTGSYAQYVVVSADAAVPVPDGMDPAIAAALPLQGMTADYLVRSTFPVGPEHTVAFYAAAGGVGGLALQMIRQAGGRVIAVVGSADKADLVVETGVPAADVIVLGVMRDLGKELPQAIRDRTDGLGVHAVFDSIGKDTFTASLASLRQRGTLVLFGGSSGQVPPFDPQELNARGSLYLTRPGLGAYTATREELLERAARVFGAADDGDLAVRVGAQFPLGAAAEAHKALESRKTVGKIVLLP
jgi:NADPH2:quinone reductase